VAVVHIFVALSTANAMGPVSGTAGITRPRLLPCVTLILRGVTARRECTRIATAKRCPAALQCVAASASPFMTVSSAVISRSGHRLRLPPSLHCRTRITTQVRGEWM
jgi:hypothetical protein